MCIRLRNLYLYSRTNSIFYWLFICRAYWQYAVYFVYIPKVCKANGKKVLIICVFELESTQGCQNYNAYCDTGVYYGISFERCDSLSCHLFVDAVRIKANANAIITSKNTVAHVRNQSYRRTCRHVTIDSCVNLLPIHIWKISGQWLFAGGGMFSTNNYTKKTSALQPRALLRCSCPVVTCILGWHIWLAIFLAEQVMIKGCLDI